MKKYIFFIVSILTCINLSYGQKISEVTDYNHALRLYDNKLYEPAVAQFRQFIIDHPGSPKAAGAQLRIGEGLYLLGSYGKAFEELELFTVKYYNSPEIEKGWYLKGESLVKQGKIREAADRYVAGAHALFDKDDPASECLLRGGRLYLQTGDIQKARECFTTIIIDYQTSKNYLPGKLELSNILLEEKHYSQCITMTSEIIGIAVDPNIKNGALLLRADAHFASGDRGNAARDYQSILRSRNISADIIYNAFLGRAKIYLLDNELDNAVSFINSFLRNRNIPDEIRGKSLVELAHIYYSQEDYEKAESSYLNALNYFEESNIPFQACYNLGVCFRKNGKIDEAVNQFNKSLVRAERDSAGGNQPEILIELMTLSLLKADIKKALGYLEDLYDFEENIPAHLWIEMMKPFEEAGYYTYAITIVNNAIKKFFRQRFIDELLYHKAELYEKAGEYTRAVEVYNELIRDFPGDTPAENARERIRYIDLIHSKKTEKEKFDEEVRVLKRLNTAGRRDGEMDRILLDLGTYYFEYRRDYEKAIGQCRDIYDSSFSQDVREEATRILAESYDNLAVLALKNDNNSIVHSLLDSALIFYHLYLNNFSGTGFRDRAILRSAEINILKYKQGAENGADPERIWTVLLDRNDIGLKDYALYKLGNYYYERGELRLSLEKYSELTRRYANSTYAEEGLYKAAYINYTMNNHREAEQLFREYSRRYPNGFHAPQARFYLGRTLIDAGKTGEAKIVFEQLVADYYYSVYADSASLWLGESLLRQGNFEEALGTLLEFREKVIPVTRMEGFTSIEIIPARVFFTLGTVYDSLKDYKNSEKELVNYLRFERDIAGREMGGNALARVLYKKGEPGRALSFFQQINANTSDGHLKYETKKMIAACYLELNRFNDAITIYDDLAKSSSSRRDKMLYTAKKIVAIYRSGDISRGDREVREFDRNFTNVDREMFYEESARFRLENGRARLAKNNPDDMRRALVAFREVGNDYGNSEVVPEAEYLKGYVQWQLNEINDAIQTLESYERRFPQSRFIGMAYSTLGSLYFGIQRFDNAYRAFKKAIEDPALKNDRNVLTYFIQSCKMADYYDEEMIAIRHYVKTFPDADNVFDMKIELGIAYMAAGDYEEAIKYLKELLPYANAQQEIEIQFYIGECYLEGLKQYDKALAEYFKIRFYAENIQQRWRVTTIERIAQCYEHLNDYEKALRYYREIVRWEGSETLMGREAERRIKLIESRMEK